MIEKNEFLQIVNDAVVDEDLVNKLEEKYNHTFPTLVKKIISLSNEPIFGEDWRNLQYVEILDPEKTLKYNFAERNQIPLLDVFDNNYLVFDYSDSLWKAVNLTDEVEYDEAEDLSSLFK